MIREDPTLNIAAGDDLEARFPGVELILFESGGDNLASTFSLDLVDWWMFVIDVAGGDDIPRKKGPGLLRCDLLVVNKIDLAPYVGVELAPMLAEAERVRAGRPVIATNARSGAGIAAVADAILAAVLFRGLRRPRERKYCWSRTWPADEPCCAASMSDIPSISPGRFNSTGCARSGDALSAVDLRRALCRGPAGAGSRGRRRRGAQSDHAGFDGRS